MLSSKFLTALAYRLPQHSVETAHELTCILIRITSSAPIGEVFEFEYMLPLNNLQLTQLFPTRTAQKIANEFKRAYKKAFPTSYTLSNFENEIKAAGARYWPGRTVQIEPYGKRHRVSFWQHGRMLAELIYNVPALLTDRLWKQKVWYAVKSRAKVELGTCHKPFRQASL